MRRNEQLVIWKRPKKIPPPHPGRAGEVIRLLVSVEDEDGLRVDVAGWDGKRFLTERGKVIAWARLPKPLEPLPPTTGIRIRSRGVGSWDGRMKND